MSDSDLTPQQLAPWSHTSDLLAEISRLRLALSAAERERDNYKEAFEGWIERAHKAEAQAAGAGRPARRDVAQ